MDENDQEFITLQNVDNVHVTTLADLKKKRELLLQKKELILKTINKNNCCNLPVTDINPEQAVIDFRQTDAMEELSSSAIFLASSETTTFNVGNLERSIDDNAKVNKQYDSNIISLQTFTPTASTHFENIAESSSGGLINLSDIINVVSPMDFQAVFDNQLYPESELEPPLIAPTSLEYNDSIPQIVVEPAPIASPSPVEYNEALSQRMVEPALNTETTFTDNNNIDSFPERELEIECARESRKRQRKANPENTKRSRNKMLRMNGKEYVGFKKSDNEKYLQDSIKPARTLGEPCTSVKCLKSQVIQCDKFTASVRQNIFDSFWQLNWQEKKMLVCSMVDMKRTTRKTTLRQNSRRNNTKTYYLKLNEQKERVCLKTFLTTLGIKEWTVRYWLGDNTSGARVSNEGRTLDSRLTITARDSIRTFLRALPKLPSHYCRKSSTKTYLEPLIQSKRELYRIYVKDSQSKSVKVGCRKLFEDILKDENIAIFQPKKDACDLCCSYKVGNLSEEVYREHISRKDLARHEKAEDKIAAKNGTVHVITADLQAVKLCPYLTASALYFKTKLMVHNFTVYNLGNDQVVCYWFDETTADLKATTYANFYVDYLTKLIDEDPKDVIIFTNGCTSQNRNSVVSNALLRLAMAKNVTITQKFLEKGHTQMEVDSVHSVIERKLKHREIYLPSQYAAITKEARLNPSPYDVAMPDYTFFKDFSIKNALIYESIRPGRGTGARCVVDIRVLKYKPDGTIDYKLNYGDEFQPLPQRSQRSRMKPVSLPQLFYTALPISKTKYEHLQQLKEVVPRDCHEFYDKLPFKN